MWCLMDQFPTIVRGYEAIDAQDTMNKCSDNDEWQKHLKNCMGCRYYTVLLRMKINQISMVPVTNRSKLNQYWYQEMDKYYIHMK